MPGSEQAMTHGQPDAGRAGSRGFERLPPPPRTVPATLRVRLWLGGLSQLGFVLLLFSTPFVWLFAANADTSGLLFRGPVSRAVGSVLSVEDTSASEGKVRVRCVRYAFRAPGSGERTATCYVTGAAPGRGEAVVVEYPEGRPGRARRRAA
jgi:hypothetical protein